MKPHLIVALIATILSLCIATISDSKPIRGIEHVSIYSLICNPEKYDGKLVKVFGYLHQGFEDSAVYASKVDGDYLNATNAIWLTINKDALIGEIGHPKDARAARLHGKFVVAQGTFRMNQNGQFGRYFSGALVNCNEVKERTVWK